MSINVINYQWIFTLPSLKQKSLAPENGCLEYYCNFLFGAFRPISSFMEPVKWEQKSIPLPISRFRWVEPSQGTLVGGAGDFSPYPPRYVAPRPTWAWHNFVMRWTGVLGVLGVECVSFNVGFFYLLRYQKTVEVLVEDHGGYITIVSSGERFSKNNDIYWMFGCINMRRSCLLPLFVWNLIAIHWILQQLLNRPVDSDCKIGWKATARMVASQLGFSDICFIYVNTRT